jgi:N utilization substance protein A
VDGERRKVPGVLENFGLSAEEADDLIMRARAHWFDEEGAAPAEEEAQPAAG